MPRRPGRVAGKTLPDPAGQSSAGGNNAQTAADPSGARGHSAGDDPESPVTRGQERAPSEPRPTPANANANTAAGTDPVGGSKKTNKLLPPSYTASAHPPSRASADPCLSCVKRLDRSPGNGCPKVPHAACGRCTKAKRKCEPVSTILTP